MRTIYIYIFLFTSMLSFGQDRLAFIKNNEIKEEVQRSVLYLNQTKVIPDEIKKRIIFITFDFDNIFDKEQSEIMGINYSTHIPTLFSKLESKSGQFKIDEKFNVIFYNYSKNIVFVFFKGSRFIDQNQLRQLSEEVNINEEILMKSEFFKYEKGNDVTLNSVENYISLEKINNKWTPVRISTFDLKTFMEVWYSLDVNEIPVSQAENKKKSKKSS